MRFFDFILLKRNDWAHDKRAIEENLGRVNAKDPLWLVVFPEGTVVSKGTRKRSSAFAEKAGLVRRIFLECQNMTCLLISPTELLTRPFGEKLCQ